MGSRKRKDRSRKVYSSAAFATRSKLRQMRTRDGGGKQKSNKFWFDTLHCDEANCVGRHSQTKVGTPKL